MTTHDVVIVGTGPAGATAGALLAGQGFRVGVVGRAPFPRGDAGITWVGPRAFALLEELGADARSILNRPISEVRFFNGDLSRSVSPDLAEAFGYVIDRSAIESVLIRAATTAGAYVRHDCPVHDILVREEGVELATENQEPLSGRLLLLAAGRQSPLMRRLGLSGRSVPEGPWTARLDAAADVPKGRSVVNVVLGLSRQGGFGLTVASGKRMTIAASVPGSPHEAVACLTRLCRALADQKMAPPGLESGAGSAVVVPPPPAALDMDSHVGKHTLVIGECGGFVSALSNESTVAAIASARIAAEVAAAALKGRLSQDELMAFDTRWRTEMADSVRPPDTDMQFLIPLIFTNRAMADRMAGAFFLGRPL
jgi:flavin-dependent dehydrogenase